MTRSYGIFIDAGSSGSRLQIYSWAFPGDRNGVKREANLPLIEPGNGDEGDWSIKVHPGISSFAEQPKHVGKKHLKKLLDYAEKVVPDDKHEETPVFLSATAGMRLLPHKTQRKILDSACHYIKKEYNFSLPDCASMVRVIDGRAEGMYGWLATNYLLGNLDKSSATSTGFLDMGGASAQIAFEVSPEVQKAYGDSVSTVHLGLDNGEQIEYPLFVYTWLGFGTSQAYNRYLNALVEGNRNSPSETIDEPCSLRGRQYSKNGHSFTGTGDLEQCLKHTYTLLNKEAPCSQDPCGFDGISIPPIDFVNHEFVGVSEFWYTTNDVFDMGGSYHFPNFYQKVGDYCASDWESMLSRLYNHQLSPSTDESKLEKLCFKASWVLNFLHEGFGFPKTNTSGADDQQTDGLDLMPAYHSHFTSLEKVDRTEISWTLGQVLLYSSNQQFLQSPKYANYQLDAFGKLIPFKDSFQDNINGYISALSVLLLIFIFGFLSFMLALNPKRRTRFKNFLLRVRGMKGRYIVNAHGDYEDIADFDDDLEMTSFSKSRAAPIRTTSSHILADHLAFNFSRERTPRSPLP
ncbi:nucleoside diphosphatase Ynd1 [Schizosaccharomyces cryophilus OY26]|uniref:Nucleoside diphosphatase Ynd1 n=1 Tax=Schizosaccharomyces cryophilus (strain OY26 / ATCC MYA-4695 / CBS 11777 / NBRC 106824 / NRRL Y48691) TaxID=653667 RepID=S9XBU3_SCHCR|nr:nucleoside diphosphatase Ynd1 [Schizosaccharomyces cryophilus OY26]EPY51301.1 nucleoside diphosphatase Ynd1 [Schizosaccharomyces cryophilus OY26]